MTRTVLKDLPVRGVGDEGELSDEALEGITGGALNAYFQPTASLSLNFTMPGAFVMQGSNNSIVDPVC